MHLQVAFNPWNKKQGWRRICFRKAAWQTLISILQNSGRLKTLKDYLWCSCHEYFFTIYHWDPLSLLFLNMECVWEEQLGASVINFLRFGFLGTSNPFTCMSSC